MLRISLRSIGRSLVQRTWIVTLVAVIVCAGFAARAAGSILAAKTLAPSPTSPAIPPRTAPPATPTNGPLDGADLVARNMFCSTCAPPEPAGPTAATFSGKPAILIATAIGKDSRATVRVPETEVQGDWGLGDHIPGVGMIDRIGPVSIDVIDANGVHETFRLLELPKSPDRTKDTAMSSGDPAPDPWADSIKKIDDKTYEVRRELVRELVTGAQKPGKVRMLPIVNKDGEVGGVRVYGVTAKSLPDAIGLKSADVIDSINGEPIKSAQQLLDLYAKLDKLDTVELGGKRRGKAMSIELRLR